MLEGIGEFPVVRDSAKEMRRGADEWSKWGSEGGTD